MTPDEKEIHENQLKNIRERGAKFAQDSINQSNEKILEDIFTSAHDGYSYMNPTERISPTIANFSALLLNLSKQAEKSTRTIVRLTWAIVFLTIILLFATILLVKKEYDDKPNLTNTTHQETNEAKRNNAVHPVMNK